MVAQIVEIVDVQSYFGQEVLNVYHFLDADGAADPAALIPVFDADVTPLLVPTQGVALTHVALRWRLVYPTVGLIRDHTVSPPKAGTNSGTAAPSMLAYSLKFTIDETVHLGSGGSPRRIRASGKRICGVNTSDEDGNSVPGSGLPALFATWFAELLSPGSDNWVPVAVRMPFTRGVPQVPASAYAPIIACSNPGLGTQNTRKVLRGRTF